MELDAEPMDCEEEEEEEKRILAPMECEEEIKTPSPQLKHKTSALNRPVYMGLLPPEI